MSTAYKVSQGSIPQPSDVNQYADILSGNGDINQISLAPSLGSPSAAPTVAAAAGTGLSVGNYKWAYTYCTGYKKTDGTVIISGETVGGPAVLYTVPSGANQAATLTFSTSNATTVVARRIYRTKVAPSSAATLAASGTGNTLTAGTYYVKFTWVYSGGVESFASPEASQAVTSGQQLTVTIPSFPSGVTSANIYVSTSSGTEVYQRNITTTSTSFTAPIATTGSNPPTASTFYLVTTINDNTSTQYTDNTADTALSTTTMPTTNSTGTFFTIVPVGPGGTNGLYNTNQNMHVSSTVAAVHHDSYNTSYVNANAYIDGSNNWQRFNTAQPSASLVIDQSGSIQLKTAAAGSGPITWTTNNVFSENNYLTRTHCEVYLSTQQNITTANSWYRILWDAVNEDFLNEYSLTNHYFTVIKPGIYALNFTLRLQGLSTTSGQTTTVIVGTNQLNNPGNYYNVQQYTLSSSNGPNANINGSQTLWLPAGTQLEVRVQVDNTNSGAVNIGPYPYTSFCELTRIM